MPEPADAKPRAQSVLDWRDLIVPDKGYSFGQAEVDIAATWIIRQIQASEQQFFTLAQVCDLADAHDKHFIDRGFNHLEARGWIIRMIHNGQVIFRPTADFLKLCYCSQAVSQPDS